MRLAQLLQTMSKYHLGLLLSLESMAKTLVPLGPWSAQGASFPASLKLGDTGGSLVDSEMPPVRLVSGPWEGTSPTATIKQSLKLKADSKSRLADCVVTTARWARSRRV